MSNRLTNIFAVALLGLMFILAVTSMAGDSLIIDELAHLPAGYSYLTQKDMRLNPEHPPLMKDLSAVPLLFIQNIKFPSDANAWRNEVNGQWEFGNIFLFKSGNPADKMIFWARMPMVLILIILGFYIFRWAKELFGNKAALLALFLFSLSPTFLAHGRFVTTDVGAAAGVLIATYYFIKFLKENSRRNLVKAGIFLGLAELAKFSVILLLPFFGILIISWALIKSPSGFKNFLKVFGRYLGLFILILIIGYAVVWLLYLYNTWNYPVEKQVSDSKYILASFKFQFLSDSVTWMAQNPVMRPAAQYLLGLFMVLQRTSGGNTGYFMGEISAAGWKTYFPAVYLMKEPLPFFVLMALAILSIFWLIKKPFWKNPKERIANWLKAHFPEFAMLLFIGIYWATSLNSNLNIGVRHLLPTFPFAILLVSYMVSNLLKQPYIRVKISLLGILLLWQAYSVIAVFPSFLAYFNEIAGGPDKGYNVVVDSNLDWGQDLRRLVNWTNNYHIAKIYVDYFGGADTKYYLGDKFLPWWGTRDPKELPSGSYLAVSATFLQQGRGRPAPGFNDPTGYYRWLDKYTPITKIGYSIFVYKIR